MGSLCIKSSNRNEIRYFKCKKCHDTFRNSCGGYSQRTSCRYHELDNDGYCLVCHEYNPRGNCYHIKKYSWFDI